MSELRLTSWVFLLGTATLACSGQSADRTANDAPRGKAGGSGGNAPNLGGVSSLGSAGSAAGASGSVGAGGALGVGGSQPARSLDGTTGGMAGAVSAGGASGENGGSCPARCGTHSWACWPMPNPKKAGLPNPASYADLGDGTVRDNVTCLTWKRAPLSGTYSYPEAKAACAALGGGYRLPTRIEFMSIIDFTVARGSTVDGDAFPALPGGYYKTASPWIVSVNNASKPQNAWIFNLSGGITSNAGTQSDKASALCVQGNADGELPATAPSDQYTSVADGEVRDNYTGLVWQVGNSPSAMPWDEAVTYCTALGLNGHAWRLPSVKELSTLVDEAQVAPAINRKTFPDTKTGKPDNWYWASHRAANVATAEWGLNFEDGYTGYNSGSATGGSSGGPAWNYWVTAWSKCVR